MRTSRLDSAGRLDIYNFDKQIQRNLDNVKKAVSEENCDLIIKYDTKIIHMNIFKST